jgi:hypothetical protein
MGTDLEWRELIDRSFGDGPEPRPIAVRLDAGRRALRRRRIVVGAAAVAVFAVLGGTAWAALPSESTEGAPAGQQGQTDRVDQTDRTKPRDAQDGTSTDPANDAPVHFGEGESLVAAPGVTILDQQPHPDLPRNFAGPNDRSAAAWIDDHGAKTYVLVRETYGEEQVIPWDKGHFDSLAAFVDFARQKYLSGEGLL